MEPYEDTIQGKECLPDEDAASYARKVGMAMYAGPSLRSFLRFICTRNVNSMPHLSDEGTDLRALIMPVHPSASHICTNAEAHKHLFDNMSILIPRKWGGSLRVTPSAPRLSRKASFRKLHSSSEKWERASVTLPYIFTLRTAFDK